MEYYDQEAIMAFLISEDVIIKHRHEKSTIKKVEKAIQDSKINRMKAKTSKAQENEDKLSRALKYLLANK